MPEQKTPVSGAFRLTSLMYFCSGQPIHFCSGVDTVGIGALRELTMNCCGTTVFVDSQPRCTQ